MKSKKKIQSEIKKKEILITSLCQNLELWIWIRLHEWTVHKGYLGIVIFMSCSLCFVYSSCACHVCWYYMTAEENTINVSQRANNETPSHSRELSFDIKEASKKVWQILWKTVLFVCFLSLYSALFILNMPSTAAKKSCSLPVVVQHAVKWILFSLEVISLSFSWINRSEVLFLSFSPVETQPRWEGEIDR